MVSNALVSNLPKQSSAPRVETLPYLMATLMLPPGKNLNKCGQPNTCDPSTPTNKPKRLWMFCGGNEPHRDSGLSTVAQGKRKPCLFSRLPASYNLLLGDIGSKCLFPPTLLSPLWGIFPVSHVPPNKAEQCLFHIRPVKSRL